LADAVVGCDAREGVAGLDHDNLTDGAAMTVPRRGYQLERVSGPDPEVWCWSDDAGV